jgi:1-acyl-sn-glycerol-3-phosphate acyltransferase
MRYQRGQPLIDFSLGFRIAEFLTFYFIWHIAELYYIFCMNVRYEGKKIIRRFKGRAILVSNHTTFLDPVLISGAVMPERTWHTMLDKTVETPFLGTLTRLLGGVPLPPGGRGLEKLRDTCDEAFRHKRFLHFYPEGECYRYNQTIMPFKSGAFFLAAKLNIPIIPVLTVFYDGKFPKDHFLGRKIPRCRSVVLEPVSPQAYIRHDSDGEISMSSVKEYAEAVRQIMQAEIDRRRQADPRAGTNAYFKGQMPRIKGIN